MNIYAKMLAVTSEIATVAKNLQVDTGAGKGYKAVSEADVLMAVKPIEAKHGIYSYPMLRRIVESGEIVTTKTYKGEQQESKRLFLRIETIYRFVNADNPEEFIDVTTYGDGVDSQDKAPGKAMTYADKYALLKAYKIRTGDDPDAEASEELRYSKVREEKIDNIKVVAITNAAHDAGVTIEQILNQYNIKTLGDMTEAMFLDCTARIRKVQEKQSKAAKA